MAVANEKIHERSSEVQVYLNAVAAHGGSHAYASLLGFNSCDATSLHRQVKAGFPFAALEKLSRSVELSTATVADAINLPARTFQRRKVKDRLRPDESDRLVRLTRIFGKAIELFDGNVAAAGNWLRTPVAALGGGLPLELVQTEPGAREVEALIGRLEHGVFA